MTRKRWDVLSLDLRLGEAEGKPPTSHQVAELYQGVDALLAALEAAEEALERNDKLEALLIVRAALKGR